MLLRAIIGDEVIADENVIKDIKEFLESDLNFQIGDPANQNRIDMINRTLDLVLEKLG